MAEMNWFDILMRSRAVTGERAEYVVRAIDGRILVKGSKVKVPGAVPGSMYTSENHYDREFLEGVGYVVARDGCHVRFVLKSNPSISDRLDGIQFSAIVRLNAIAHRIKSSIDMIPAV